MKGEKKITSIRLSVVGQEILKGISEKHYGLPHTSIIEMALRELAKKEGIELSKEEVTA